jgi:hypothetical protein
MHMYATNGRNTLHDKDWGFNIRYVLREAKASGRLADLKRKRLLLQNLT